jgi:hypothetical protein
MAAKRLGAALTNVTGTASQLLRVKSDESGFEFYTPATIPVYAVTNKTLDRAIDCSNSDIDEIANVLGTLIDDLAALGPAVSGSQSRFVSQEYTHTANVSSGTSYTLNHNFGSEPDLIICQAKLPSGDGVWKIVNDMVLSVSDYYGMEVVDPGSSLNTSVVRLFGIAYHDGSVPAQISGTVTVRFLCFKLGIATQTQAFQWSASEQVYPFEKASDGSTLYCKEIYFGTLPDTGSKSVAHNISPSLTPSKVHAFYGILSNDSLGDVYQLGFASQASQFGAPIVLVFLGVNVNVYTGTAYYANNGHTAKIRIIYAK